MTHTLPVFEQHSISCTCARPKAHTLAVQKQRLSRYTSMHYGTDTVNDRIMPNSGELYHGLIRGAELLMLLTRLSTSKSCPLGTHNDKKK